VEQAYVFGSVPLSWAMTRSDRRRLQEDQAEVAAGPVSKGQPVICLGTAENVASFLEARSHPEARHRAA